MQFWVIKPAALGADQGRWWNLVLSKRADSFGEEKWWEVFRGNEPPPPEAAPFRVCDVLPKNEQGDVMYTDLLGISFSAKLAEILLGLGCTGFSPQPSRIYDKHDRDLVCSDAKWTQFQRGCGPVDDSRGYDACHPFRGTVGLFFDVSSWTGLDMFKPHQHPAVVITDRIATAIRSKGLKGYRLERVEEYGSDIVHSST